MKKLRNMKAGLALGTFTATLALLSGLSTADAQTAPGGGSFPGSFLVPGTNTSLKIGGYTKLDLIYDFSARNGDTSDPKAIVLDVGPGVATSPNHQLNHAFRMHAKESRFNFETRTPTGFGELKTFIEVDFFGSAIQQTVPANNTNVDQSRANSELPRLRHAYGTLGPLLAGQTFTLWFDADAYAEILDGGGDVGGVQGQSIRAPQIRYTYAGPSGLSLALSIENPEVTIFQNANNVAVANAINTTTVFSNGIDRVPDVVAAARWDQAFGHIRAAALYRDMKIVNPDGARAMKQGWGGELSGHLNTFGKDRLGFNAFYGIGVGQFNYGSTNQSLEVNTLAVTPGVGVVAKAPITYGGFANYQHWWTDELRTNVVGGYDRIRNIDSIITALASQAALERKHYTTHVNLIWSPVPQVDLGVEYSWMRRFVESGASGDENRFQASAKFKF